MDDKIERLISELLIQKFAKQQVEYLTDGVMERALNQLFKNSDSPKKTCVLFFNSCYEEFLKDAAEKNETVIDKIKEDLPDIFMKSPSGVKEISDLVYNQHRSAIRIFIKGMKKYHLKQLSNESKT